jgi:hypothetical protein
MTNQERAQKIMEAYKAEDTYNFPNDGVAAALREIANCFKYDSYLCADDFYEIANELEALQ